jgi:hypothetical protein
MLDRIHAVCLLLAIVLLASPGAQVMAAQPDPVGAAQAVKPDVKGVLASVERAYKAGDKVFADERISTAPGASLRIVFEDGSRLEIGPGSELLIDDAVFSRRRSKQSMVLDFVKGVFRFTTGRLQKAAYKFKLGLNTLGVRGTRFAIVADDKGKALLKVEKGRVIIKGAKGKALEVRQSRGARLDNAAGTAERADASALSGMESGLDGMEGSLDGAETADVGEGSDADAGDTDGASDSGDSDGDAGSDSDSGSDGGSDSGSDGGSDGGGDGGGGDGGGGD